MITADTLKTLTTFTAPALTRAAQDAGYKGPAFSGAKFLGITNGGQFCYKVAFPCYESTKVFLTYDHANDRVIADYHLTELA